MFNEKSLIVEIQADTGEYKEGDDVIVFQNVPIEAKIDRSGMNYGATVKIYGVSKHFMDAMTLVRWKVDFVPQRFMRISTKVGKEKVLLFEGNIEYALPMYSSAPNVYIEIQAFAGMFYNVVSFPPDITSFKGSIPAPDLIKRLADHLGMGFVNYGVNTVAQNPSFNESGLRQRVDAIARAYNFVAIVENRRIRIYPKTSDTPFREWEIDKNNYIGYPSFTSSGINVVLDEVFDIELQDWFTIKDSEIEQANDTWIAKKVVFNLSTKIGGKWQMSIDGVRNGTG